MFLIKNTIFKKKKWHEQEKKVSQKEIEATW
jgi:predicted transporter